MSNIDRFIHQRRLYLREGQIISNVPKPGDVLLKGRIRDNVEKTLLFQSKSNPVYQVDFRRR